MTDTEKKIAEVLPAYAGMIPRRLSWIKPGNGAPRVCGDDPDPAACRARPVACSPRMRG